MPEPPVVEIRVPGEPVRRVSLERAIEVGRECDGEILSDPSVSRVHLKLVPSPTSLSVVDMGSRNGTLLNGNGLTGRAVLEPGDVIRLGQTEIVVIGRPPPPAPPSRPRATVAVQAVAAPSVPAPPAVPVVETGPTPLRRFTD